MSKYTPELKDKVLRLYFEDGGNTRNSLPGIPIKHIEEF